MSGFLNTDPNASEPTQTHPDQFGDWLTVSEAVIYCSLFGLSRTPKTIRKWAQRSFGDPESAELEVRREDVTHGFRWTVSRVSLDRKIEQELEFEARSAGEREQPSVETVELVRTGAATELREFVDEHSPEPDQTRPLQAAPVQGSGEMVDELRRQIDRLEREIAFYREELIDRRQSATALVDVIRAFRLNAETNAQSSRERASVQSTPRDAGQEEPAEDADWSDDQEDRTNSKRDTPRTVNLHVRSTGDNASGIEDYRV